VLQLPIYQKIPVIIMGDKCKGDIAAEFDPIAHGLDSNFRLTNLAGLKG